MLVLPSAEKVKRDLDRCDISECDRKEPEKPVVPENFGPKRPRHSSRIIMNINSPISQSEMDSNNFDPLDNEGDCLLKNRERRLKSRGSSFSTLMACPLSVVD